MGLVRRKGVLRKHWLWIRYPSNNDAENFKGEGQSRGAVASRLLLDCIAPVREESVGG